MSLSDRSLLVLVTVTRHGARPSDRIHSTSRPGAPPVAQGKPLRTVRRSQPHPTGTTEMTQRHISDPEVVLSIPDGDAAQPQVSLVIPALNEASALARNLPEIVAEADAKHNRSVK